MSKEVPTNPSATFHETVDFYTNEVVTNTNHRGIIPDSVETIQTADIDGQRLTVNTEHRTDGLYRDELKGEYEINDRKEVSAAVSPIEDLGNIPEDIPGNEVDLGLRNSFASLAHDRHNGDVSSSASVKTSAGEYAANSDRYRSGTRVNREGYGEVVIKSPEAKKLVAKLAGKKIVETQIAIQDLKGKEDVQDREWHKTARRRLRRAIGKKVA